MRRPARSANSGPRCSAATMLLAPLGARAEATPGVSASEITIGSTTSYSGPVSAPGALHRAQIACFRMLNQQGGTVGRKLRRVLEQCNGNFSRQNIL